MALIDDLLFEVGRRVVLFNTNTTLPSGDPLGYDADPNLADPLNSDGEFLIYNCPQNSRYAQSDGTQWYKKEAPNTWEQFGAGGGDATPPYTLNFTTSDWISDSGSYYIEIPAGVHAQGSTKSLVAFVYKTPSPNEYLLASYSVSDLGIVRINSDEPFNGYAIVSGLVGSGGGGGEVTPIAFGEKVLTVNSSLDISAGQNYHTIAEACDYINSFSVTTTGTSTSESTFQVVDPTGIQVGMWVDSIAFSGGGLVLDVTGDLVTTTLFLADPVDTVPISFHIASLENKYKILVQNSLDASNFNIRGFVEVECKNTILTGNVTAISNEMPTHFTEDIFPEAIIKNAQLAINFQTIANSYCNIRFIDCVLFNRPGDIKQTPGNCSWSFSSNTQCYIALHNCSGYTGPIDFSALTTISDSKNQKKRFVGTYFSFVRSDIALTVTNQPSSIQANPNISSYSSRLRIVDLGDDNNGYIYHDKLDLSFFEIVDSIFLGNSKDLFARQSGSPGDPIVTKIYNSTMEETRFKYDLVEDTNAIYLIINSSLFGCTATDYSTPSKFYLINSSINSQLFNSLQAVATESSPILSEQVTLHKFTDHADDTVSYATSNTFGVSTSQTSFTENKLNLGTTLSANKLYIDKVRVVFNEPYRKLQWTNPLVTNLTLSYINNPGTYPVAYTAPVITDYGSQTDITIDYVFGSNEGSQEGKAGIEYNFVQSSNRFHVGAQFYTVSSPGTYPFWTSVGGDDLYIVFTVTSMPVADFSGTFDFTSPKISFDSSSDIYLWKNFQSYDGVGSNSTFRLYMSNPPTPTSDETFDKIVLDNTDEKVLFNVETNDGEIVSSTNILGANSFVTYPEFHTTEKASSLNNLRFRIVDQNGTNISGYTNGGGKVTLFRSGL